MRHFTFVEAARLLGVTPMDVRLMVEEGRLRAVRRGGTRMVPEDELDEAHEASGAEPEATVVSPPLRVVLARLEEKAAELVEVRRELDHARSRHAEELKALRREVRELRDSSRRAMGEDRPKERRMRRTLGPLFGVDPADEPTDR